MSTYRPRAGPDPGSADRDRATPTAASNPPSPRAGQPEPGSAERLAYSIDEAARLTGLSRDLLYDEMRRGNLLFVKSADAGSSPAITCSNSSAMPRRRHFGASPRSMRSPPRRMPDTQPHSARPADNTHTRPISGGFQIRICNRLHMRGNSLHLIL